MPTTLTRTAASAAIEHTAWRVLLATLATSVPVDSLAQAVQVAQGAVQACGADAEEHLRLDIRPTRVEIILQSGAAGITDTDVELSQRISDAVAQLGVRTGGVLSSAGNRSVQQLEIAIDALDIASIRPFWRAVLGYGDEPAGGGPTDAVIDLVGQGPAIWFQQLDQPRPQRNRIHFDIVVAHDEAPGRIRAALDAGGVLVSAAEARSFWILADAEGNEICVCTWQDRDPPAAE